MRAGERKTGGTQMPFAPIANGDFAVWED